jgi:lysozyme
MKTSMKGRDLIRKYEGEKLKAYLCPAGVWTIGVGHTGPDVKPGLVITTARSDELLRSDVARFESAISGLLRVQVTQNQFDALEQGGGQGITRSDCEAGRRARPV